MGRALAPRDHLGLGVAPMSIVLTIYTIVLSVVGMAFGVCLIRDDDTFYKVLWSGLFLMSLSLPMLPAEYFGLIPRIGP
jgi:hypothetical membrane protein